MKTKPKNKKQINHKVTRSTSSTPRRFRQRNPQILPSDVIYNYGHTRGLIYSLQNSLKIKDPVNIKLKFSSEQYQTEFMEGLIAGMEDGKIQFKLIPKNRIKFYIQDLIDESLIMEFEVRQLSEN